MQSQEKALSTYGCGPKAKNKKLTKLRKCLDSKQSSFAWPYFTPQEFIRGSCWPSEAAKGRDGEAKGAKRL